MKNLIIFCAAIIISGTCLIGELACQGTDEGAFKSGPYAASQQPKPDPAVVKKLDEISKAIKELKDDLSKIKEELNTIKIRVTK